MWRRSANIQFANLKIVFLSNQSEYRKSLTHFCSLSPTDWHFAVCLVVRASRKAGNSVYQIVSVFRLNACVRLPLNQILKRFISSDFTFYYLYGDIYFSMVIAKTTRIRMILRKTPLKVHSNLNCINSTLPACAMIPNQQTSQGTMSDSTSQPSSRAAKSSKFALLSRAIKHSYFILKFFPYRIVNLLNISSVFTELKAFLP